MDNVMKHAPGWVRLLARFWTKINNDWIFNLANMLAYILLLSIFPMLFVVLEIGGFIFAAVAPGQGHRLIAYLQGLLPSGNQLLINVSYNLGKAGSFLFVLFFLLAIFTGSRLFLTLENAFSLVFRVPGRTIWRQNLMSVIMTLIFAILLPLMLLASLLPSTIVSLTQVGANSAFGAFLLQVLGGAVAVATSIVFFGVIYYFVPNRHTRLREIVRGTLVGSALLVIYEIVFPLFAHLVIRPQTYGATVGIIVAILTFFFYLSFIIVIGAEIDAWALGLRNAPADIARMLHWAEPFYHQKTGDTFPGTESPPPDEEPREPQGPREPQEPQEPRGPQRSLGPTPASRGTPQGTEQGAPHGTPRGALPTDFAPFVIAHRAPGTPRHTWPNATPNATRPPTSAEAHEATSTSQPAATPPEWKRDLIRSMEEHDQFHAGQEEDSPLDERSETPLF